MRHLLPLAFSSEPSRTKETHNRQKLLLQLGGTCCKNIFGIGPNGLLGGRDFEVVIVEAGRDIDQETHGPIDIDARVGLAAGDVRDKRMKLRAMLTALCNCVNESGQKMGFLGSIRISC